MHRYLPAVVVLSFLHLACSGSPREGEPMYSPGDGATGGVNGGGVGTGGSGAGSGGTATDGTGGSGTGGAVGSTYCERWAALGPGELPGFATDSVCDDFSDILMGDVSCSGASNSSAQIAQVALAQNHVLTPTSDDYTHNDGGGALAENGIRPKFRLISHRPALLMVAVNGSGAAPEVRVTARRNGAELGSLCLKGPAALSSSTSNEPNLDEHFTVSLPAEWIRSGLELELQAGDQTREIPASDLRVAGGVRHIVVEAAMLLYGNTTLSFVPKDNPNEYVMADELPVQSLVWAKFPVPVVFDPFTMSARSGNPPRVVTAHEGSFDEVGECLDVLSEIRRANGHVWETGYYASLKSGGSDGWGGGLGGGNGAAGPASQLMIRHEGGHAYGLPHMEDAYAAGRYPFAKRTNGTGCVLGVPGEDGCGVGPAWKFFQTRHQFASPWENEQQGVYIRDPMAGGGNNWFGAYTDQWVLDYMQNRMFWDDERESYMSYDPATGEFAENHDVANDNWYGRPEQRDVPLYTLFGTYSDDVSAVNVIQKPLHYRGHLLRVMDPTRDADLQWLKDNNNQVCGNGCDLVLRVVYNGSEQRNVLINRARGNYVRWAVNVPDVGELTRAELYVRPVDNGGGNSNISGITVSNFFDQATLVAERNF